MVWDYIPINPTSLSIKSFIDNDVGKLSTMNKTKWGLTMKNKYCDVCGETDDETCFTGTGICASEHDDETERHLSRYITNRNKRTGKTWTVTRRYETVTKYAGFDDVVYQRAIVTSDGVDVRIYYRPKRFRKNRCWVRA